MMTKYAAIIPAYNEEASIAIVVNAINDFGQQQNINITPIVVNDCSTDNTYKIASSLHCVTLSLPVNLGIGGAVQTGLIYAWKNNFDFAIQVDGDGQHPANEIIKLINQMEKLHLDVVIGSRFITKSGFQSTLLRRIGINYFSLLIRLLTGFKITDCTSGFRLYNKKALEILKDRYPDEYPEPEAFIIFKKEGLQAGEASVIMEERKGGTSSISGISSLYYIFKVTLAILFKHISYTSWKEYK